MKSKLDPKRKIQYIPLQNVGLLPVQALEDTPIFLKIRDYYLIQCCYLDLEELAKLARTSRIGHERFRKEFLKNPKLILNALLKMDKNKISKFLRHYPAITELILALRYKQVQSPFAYTLWTMVANIYEIEALALQNCMNFFEDNNNFCAVHTLNAVKIMKELSEELDLQVTFNSHYNNLTWMIIHPECYLNLHGLHLVTNTRPDAVTLLEGFDLSGANLKGVVLRNVYLKLVTLKDADCSGAVFYNVSSLSELDCRGVNFTGAQLHSFKLRSDNSLVHIEGANFEGARFFPVEIMTIAELRTQLELLPPAYLSQGDECFVLNRKNHDILCTRVLDDLIRTVNLYTEDDFIKHRRRPFLYFGNAPSTLTEFKVRLLKAAQKHDFFGKPQTMFTLQLNGFFSCGLSNKPAIFTPAARVLQREIERILAEDPEYSRTCAIL